MNPDFLDMLAALDRAGARFIVVGAHALGVHGTPRATGDLDVWVDPTPENAALVWRALLEFGAPVAAMNLAAKDLTTPDTVVQIGLPPARIDLLTSLTGLTFDEAWAGRTRHSVGALDVPFLGKDALIKNKRACGRPKDLADLQILER